VCEFQRVKVNREGKGHSNIHAYGRYDIVACAPQYIEYILKSNHATALKKKTVVITNASVLNWHIRLGFLWYYE
jgi:hypothetical protein